MTLNEFDREINKQIDYCKELMLSKGHEYAENADTDSDLAVDRLDHFKKAAVMLDETTEQAIMGMFIKHIVSLSDMVNSKEEYTIEKWTEKITDSMNYLLILKACLVERETKKLFDKTLWMEV